MALPREAEFGLCACPWYPCPPRSPWFSCFPVGQSPWGFEVHWDFRHCELSGIGLSWQALAHSVHHLCWWPGLWGATPPGRALLRPQHGPPSHTGLLLLSACCVSCTGLGHFRCDLFLKPERFCQLGVISVCQKRKLRLRKEQKFVWPVAWQSCGLDPTLSHCKSLALSITSNRCYPRKMNFFVVLILPFQWPCIHA